MLEFLAVGMVGLSFQRAAQIEMVVSLLVDVAIAIMMVVSWGSGGRRRMCRTQHHDIPQ